MIKIERIPNHDYTLYIYQEETKPDKTIYSWSTHVQLNKRELMDLIEQGLNYLSPIETVDVMRDTKLSVKRRIDAGDWLKLQRLVQDMGEIVNEK